MHLSRCVAMCEFMISKKFSSTVMTKFSVFLFLVLSGLFFNVILTQLGKDHEIKSVRKRYLFIERPTLRSFHETCP